MRGEGGGREVEGREVGEREGGREVEGREVGEREGERERKDSDQGFIQDFEVGGMLAV